MRVNAAQLLPGLVVLLGLKAAQAFIVLQRIALSARKACDHQHIRIDTGQSSETL